MRDAACNAWLALRAPVSPAAACSLQVIDAFAKRISAPHKVNLSDAKATILVNLIKSERSGFECPHRLSAGSVCKPCDFPVLLQGSARRLPSGWRSPQFRRTPCFMQPFAPWLPSV